MVFKRVSWFMTLAALVWAVPASAQQPRAEISLLVGWVLSDGVDGDPVVTGDGEIYDRIDPKDSAKWGLMGGVLLGDYGNAEVGFMFGQQMSQMVVGGTNDVGDRRLDHQQLSRVLRLQLFRGRREQSGRTSSAASVPPATGASTTRAATA